MSKFLFTILQFMFENWSKQVSDCMAVLC